VSRGKYDSQEHGVGIARLLLERGVGVNAPDKDHNTPLHSASYLGRPEIARELLDHGAKVGSENDRAQTPLHLVSQGSYWLQDDSLGVAKLLLERGADMNIKDKDYATPLHLACYRGRLDIARVLLSYDAKAQAESDSGPITPAAQVSILPTQGGSGTRFPNRGEGLGRGPKPKNGHS
jgi:ankyrin repeat protein